MSTEAQAGVVIEGKYRLERELGAGGMGSVWLATQLMVDRSVAVKLLHPAFVDQDEIQARFEVEAKAIGKLNHPNTITLYDFGFSDGLDAFYTVIEYIDGVSLDKRLNERMPLTEVTSIIRQVALALDHAHHHGILHRDLKPENVMLATMTDGSQIAKVLDFGIARIVKGSYEVESPESQRITKAGEVFGTPAYMSPEQARSIRRLTPASDLYSLGIMFYELVAGRLPFFAKSAFDLLMLHVTKPVPPIERGDVPPELIRIIYRLLEKDPDARFQTGAEVARAIERVAISDEPKLDDDFDQYDTLVSPPSMTAAFQQAAAALGAEETNPERPSLSNSQASAVPYGSGPSGSTEIRANTVLLHGGGREHHTDAISPVARREKMIAVAVMIALLLLVVAGVMTMLLGKQATEPALQDREAVRRALQTPQSADGPSLAEQATAVPEPKRTDVAEPKDGDIPAATPESETPDAGSAPEGEPPADEAAAAADKPNVKGSEAGPVEKRVNSSGAKPGDKKARVFTAD